MSYSRIIAAERCIGQQGDLSPAYRILDTAKSEGLRITTLTIDDLNTPWDSPVAHHHFRSGCAPLEALSVANRLIQDDEADLVAISGRDDLRTGYTPEERHRKMDIYPEASIPEAYTQLARSFCQRHGLSESGFLELRDAVFDNLLRTANEQGLEKPSERWFQPLTDLFRGVDCANPVIDFQGLVLVSNAGTTLQPTLATPVAIQGVGIGIAENDGPQYIRDLSGYHALEKAIHYTGVQCGEDIAQLITDPDILLEAYTCYPVVPLALLMATGKLRTEADILSVLKTKPLTCTGGMNLARAPWNNPALNGLIALCHRMQTQHSKAVLHGNGGLGYRQGIALLTPILQTNAPATAV